MVFRLRADETGPRESCPSPTQTAVCLELLAGGNGTEFSGRVASASYSAQGWQGWTALPHLGLERFLGAGPGFPLARAPVTVIGSFLLCFLACLSPCWAAEFATWTHEKSEHERHRAS